jgi:hypothetical protein
MVSKYKVRVNDEPLIIKRSVSPVSISRAAARTRAKMISLKEYLEQTESLGHDPREPARLVRWLLRLLLLIILHSIGCEKTRLSGQPSESIGLCRRIFLPHSPFWEFLKRLCRSWNCLPFFFHFTY